MERKWVSRMGLGRAIVITSGKGGTGKTSVTGGIGSCLAALGKSVICLDADVGLRNLDIVLGLNEKAVLDFFNVMSGEASLESAAVTHPDIPGLSLLTAPAVYPKKWPNTAQMKGLIGLLKQKYDYCLIDSPAGLGSEFDLAACAADEAIVVTTPDIISVRDGAHVAAKLSRMNISARLVVNRVRSKLMSRSGAVNIDDTMDGVGLRLLGIVPEDESVITCSNLGTPVILYKRTGASVAYLNIARRLMGARVPLMKL